MIRLSGRDGVALLAVGALSLPVVGLAVHAQTANPQVRTTILRGDHDRAAAGARPPQPWRKR